MTGFYGMPFGFVCVCTFLGFLAILLEGSATVVCVLEWKKSALYLSELLTEAAALLSTFAAYLLLSQVLTGYRSGVIFHSGFSWLRRFAFVFCGICTVVSILQKGSNNGIFLTVAAFVLTPLCEKLAGDKLPVFLIWSGLTWYIHAIRQIMHRTRDLTSGITSLSVNEAMESIPTAVLFYRPDGRIIFQNKKMTALEYSMFGQTERNGNHVFERLQTARVDSRCTALEQGAQSVYRLSDGTVWLFSVADVHIPHCDCRQLCGHDITAHWDAGEALEKENAELQKRGEELKAGLSRLKETCMEEERQKARNRVHDILGQHVSILLRAIRQQSLPEESFFAAFEQGLPKVLFDAETKNDAFEDFEVLQKTMASIGVDVIFHGVFQAPEKNLRLAADFSTEAVTNAVRHGLAQRVDIHFRREAGGYRLQIADDGMGCTSAPSEGGGITSMRKTLEEIGGWMEIDCRKHFILTVWMPEEIKK